MDDEETSDHYRIQNIKKTSAAILYLLCKMDNALLGHLIGNAAEAIKKKEHPNAARMILVLNIIGPLCRKEPFVSQLVDIFQEISL